MKRLSSLSFLIPDKFEGQKVLERKAKVTIFMHAFVILLAFMFLSADISFDLHYTDYASKVQNFFYVVITLLTAFSMFLFKRHGNFFVSGNWIAGQSFLLLGIKAIVTGGLYSDDILWLILCPIVAFILAGRRSGFIWFLLLQVFLFVVYYLEWSLDTSLKANSLIINDPTFYYISVSTLFFTIVTSIYIYENEKATVIKELEAQHELTYRQNLEISTQSSLLKVAKEEVDRINDELEIKVKERTALLEKSNKELLRSNQELEQFAYVASHDLQEPLRMVGNFVQLLESEYNDKLDENGRIYIQYAVDAASRMSILIEDLLSFSRVGRANASFSLIDLDVLINTLWENIQNKSKKAITIKKMELPTIIGDRKLVVVLFNNLFSNAIKFNKNETPIVEVNWSENQDFWQIEIKDNGIGIRANNEEKVFEVFKRLNRKEEYSGTGIGLAICKKICLYHNGDIWFNSKFNQGTSFFFKISKHLKKL